MLTITISPLNVSVTLNILLVIILAYFCGSIPFGFLTAKLVAGIDLRKAGSGNVGATNVGRILGTKWGIFVLLLDATKGAVPVGVLPLITVGNKSELFNHLGVLAAVFAIIGHMFPVWLHFKGGKGVATALGVVTVLAPWGTLGALTGFLLIFATTRIVSLASIIGVTAFAVTQLTLLGSTAFNFENYSLSLFSIAAPALIIWQHRSNIGRLMRGDEEKYHGKPKNHEAASSADQHEV